MAQCICFWHCIIFNPIHSTQNGMQVKFRIEVILPIRFFYNYDNLILCGKRRRTLLMYARVKPCMGARRTVWYWLSLRDNLIWFPWQAASNWYQNACNSKTRLARSISQVYSPPKSQDINRGKLKIKLPFFLHKANGIIQPEEALIFATICISSAIVRYILSCTSTCISLLLIFLLLVITYF